MTDNIANALCVSFIASSGFHTFQGLALKPINIHIHPSGQEHKTEAAIDNHNLIRFILQLCNAASSCWYSCAAA
jgi:hypothetical protein